MNSSRDYLVSKNLRITESRIKILDYFLSSKKAFSHADLERVFSSEMDRVSIYRILHAFEEKELICKIIDSNANVLYSFAGAGKSHHDHPHFKCNECDQVQHLPEIPKQYFDQFKNHKITHLQLTVEGTCEKCLNK